MVCTLLLFMLSCGACAGYTGLNPDCIANHAQKRLAFVPKSLICYILYFLFSTLCKRKKILWKNDFIFSYDIWKNVSKQGFIENAEKKLISCLLALFTMHVISKQLHRKLEVCRGKKISNEVLCLCPLAEFSVHGMLKCMEGTTVYCM